MDGTGIALLFSGAATDDQVPNACDVRGTSRKLSLNRQSERKNTASKTIESIDIAHLHSS